MSRPSRAAPPPPPADEHGEDKGASANERLLAAAKSDNEELLQDALVELDDVNYADGLGNTGPSYQSDLPTKKLEAGLWTSIIHASTSCLEPLLEHETCDVDLRNRLNGDTPLHIAVRTRWEEYDGLRLHLVGSLLDAGADTTIKNRHNQRPADLLPQGAEPGSDDEQVRQALRRAEAEAMVADSGDVVNEDDIIDPNDIASDSD